MAPTTTTFEEKDPAAMEKTIENLDLLKNMLAGCEPTLTEILRKESLLKTLEIKCERSRHSRDVAKDMYQKILKNSSLKVISTDVAKGILPPGYSCKLHDVIILSYATDDEEICAKDEWIRNNVSCGLSFIEVVGENEKSELDFAIYANKKFTGRIVDEDDIQPESSETWLNFFIDSPANATEVICVKKIEGCCGHFAVRKIDGEYYIIVGSSRIHIMIQSHSDIRKYPGPRYETARTVARVVLNTFDGMDPSKLNILKHFLSVTKTTVVCELLITACHQRILIDHFLLRNESKLYGLMMTSVPGDCENGENDSLTAVSPRAGLELLKLFGISTPECYSISPDAVQKEISKIRRMKNCEGYVLYYLKDDRTIGMKKVKTIWYVVLRALQEKICYVYKNANGSLSFLLDRKQDIETIFSKLRRGLDLCVDCLDKWINLAIEFISWLNDKIITYGFYSSKIRYEFSGLWEEYTRAKDRGNIQFCCC